MKITSAQFIKGFVHPEDIASETLPQYAFIGRSNVGKSSLINTLTKIKGLAKTSSFPGHTQEINFFLINKKFHLVDLPGYGFARVSVGHREKILRLIKGYLFGDFPQLKKIVLMVDGVVGPTADDIEMLDALRTTGKEIIIAVNKVDKIKSSEQKKQLGKIQDIMKGHVLVPISATKRTGVGELVEQVFQY
jgi:GTP-binding protein